MGGSRDWAIESIEADAQTLHSSDLPARRGVWAMRPTRYSSAARARFR